MSSLKTVLIAEDHALVRKGLRSLLGAMDRVEVVGEAADGYETLDFVKSHKPDIVLLDLSMPKLGGLGAIRQIKQISPKTKILVITMHGSQDYLIPAFKDGADGYLLKGADPEELFMAMKAVMSSRSYISSEISSKVIQGFLTGAPENPSPLDSLTPRENEIFVLVAEGYTNKQIAERLFISHKTVDKHRSNLMSKLDLHNARQVTALAKEHGILM